MRAWKVVPLSALLLVLLVTVTFAYTVRPGPASPPASTLSLGSIGDPYVLSYGGDTTWIRVHVDSSYCPGDPYWGHGGEATGGPGPAETWCFEGGPGDSCGTYPPYDTNCFDHEDVRTHPSPMDVNYWHLDSYRTDQRPYCGDYALWCGSDSIWTDGHPVECGSWASGKYPGYGNQWNCIVQLDLPDTFDVAGGCTLYFDPRYDTECKYDYFYLDVWNDSAWVTLATFNATSNNPGAECGASTGGSPDYWANTDTNRLANCDWQERVTPGEPAFLRVIAPGTLVVTQGPKLRWRFTSDGAWSDADGRGDTDGAAFIDNVWVRGDAGNAYEEDFEDGSWAVLEARGWSLPDPQGLVDAWHIAHDSDPPYEGGDGGDRVTCLVDSSWAWRGRPEGGYPAGASWRNGWYYRLMSPRIPIQNSGCVVQYDQYAYYREESCDYSDTKVRFYESDQSKWCSWINMDGYIITPSSFPNYDRNEAVTKFYDETADSMQFCWELMDVSSPNDFCRGRHKETDHQVDNVSIGFFDADATWFSARIIDILQDTFHDNLCAYNSHFDAYDPDTVDHYSGPPYDDVTIRKTCQLYLDVEDPDGISIVELYGSIDEGGSWVSVEMQMAQPFDPDHPERGGEYYGTLCPDDFGLDTWEAGTEVLYYVEATDELSNEERYPHTVRPFSFSILPMYPPTYTGPRVLLVDGYGRRNYDWSPCLDRLDNVKQLDKIYEATLTDAGYCYDKYDISGAGSNVHVQPIEFADYYDCVVWFCGPYFSNYLFDAEAQYAIRDYMADSGKVVLCGDRVAYNMASWDEGGVGEDSLGGEFLAGIMGCDYLGEMEGPFDKPYVYAAAVETIDVFGSPVEVALDTLLVYRECPYLKDMSYVVANGSPPAGYAAQSLLRLLNPDPAYDPSDMAVYVEYLGAGQCAFVDFDLCASANHERGYCSGDVSMPAPDFNAGAYDGRVDLMRVILEDLFGLPSVGGGGPGGVTTPDAVQPWVLAQNVPNPCTGPTEISYSISQACRVELKVYNALGQVVRVLEDGRRDAGPHVAHWDGLNAAGERVGSGVYFYKIEAGSFTATRKMLVLR